MRNIKELLEFMEKISSEFETRFDIENVDSLDDLSEEDFDGDSPFDYPLSGTEKSLADFLEDHPLFSGGLSQQDSMQFTEPLYEVVEEDTEVVVIADVPGFEENQISLSADENQVRIDAESTDDMRRESMSQVFRLPCEVIPEEAEATLENGVLTITLPRVDVDDGDQTTIEIS